MARLDRLAPVKEVAQVAAVIGREFGYELLAAVGAAWTARLEDALRPAGGGGAGLPARATPPDATYAFKHALVRDAAYQSLLKSRRQELHARIAAGAGGALPRGGGGRAGAAGPPLRGGRPEPSSAIDYWQRAARGRSRARAEAEAVGHLQTALAQLDRVPEVGRRAARSSSCRRPWAGALDRARLRGAGDGSAPTREAAAGPAAEVGSRLFPVLWGRIGALRIAGRCWRPAIETAREFLRARDDAATPATS